MVQEECRNSGKGKKNEEQSFKEDEDRKIKNNVIEGIKSNSMRN